MKYLPKNSILNILIFISTLFFLFACASVQPTTEPTPPVKPTIGQTQKQELPDYYSVKEPPPPKPPPAPPTVSPKVTPPPPPLPLRITQVIWAYVNLREGPGMNYKVIGNVKKGTSLKILEVTGDWLHVRLEDGSEAWVSKLATSEASNPSPSQTPPKPTPM